MVKWSTLKASLVKCLILGCNDGTYRTQEIDPPNSGYFQKQQFNINETSAGTLITDAISCSHGFAGDVMTI